MKYAAAHIKTSARSGIHHFLGNLRLAVLTRRAEAGVVTLNGLLFAPDGAAL